jgi:hypothetical protein
LARIAAVHLKIPDLPSAAVREAMAAEDSLIKYTRGEGAGAANWDSALHPRAGTPPNPGWFATTGGGHDPSGARFAENQVDSHRIDDVPISDDKKVKPPPDYRIGEPASFVGPSGSKDQPGSGDFWSNVRSAISNWLQELVPEYDLEKAAKWWGNDRGGASSRLMWVFQARPRRSSPERLRVYQRFHQRLVSAAVRLKPPQGRQQQQVR